MGRHRPDPRGHARILVAAFAVVLALALLIVGAIALFGAMTSKPDTPGATATSTASRAPQSAEVSTGAAVGPHVLVVKVTGPSAQVTISNTANTVVYFTGTLNHGETRVSDKKDLVVTVDPVQNVDVEINGRNVSRGKTGKFVQTIGPS